MQPELNNRQIRHLKALGQKLDPVVVIGRNEGERLSRCLRSVGAADWGPTRHELIYVDSNSSDEIGRAHV